MLDLGSTVVGIAGGVSTWLIVRSIQKAFARRRDRRLRDQLAEESKTLASTLTTLEATASAQVVDSKQLLAACEPHGGWTPPDSAEALRLAALRHGEWTDAVRNLEAASDTARHLLAEAINALADPLPATTAASQTLLSELRAQNQRLRRHAQALQTGVEIAQQGEARSRDALRQALEQLRREFATRFRECQVRRASAEEGSTQVLPDESIGDAVLAMLAAARSEILRRNGQVWDDWLNRLGQLKRRRNAAATLVAGALNEGLAKRIENRAMSLLAPAAADLHQFQIDLEALERELLSRMKADFDRISLSMLQADHQAARHALTRLLHEVGSELERMERPAITDPAAASLTETVRESRSLLEGLRQMARLQERIQHQLHALDAIAGTWTAHSDRPTFQRTCKLLDPHLDRLRRDPGCGPELQHWSQQVSRALKKGLELLDQFARTQPTLEGLLREFEADALRVDWLDIEPPAEARRFFNQLADADYRRQQQQRVEDRGPMLRARENGLETPAVQRIRTHDQP